MKTLITPAQVVALAFANGEYLAPEAITEADITAAVERYIVPMTGRRLYDRLTEGVYAEFASDYLAAPLALYTRLLIQPGLDIRTGQCGSVSPKSTSFQPAAEISLRHLRRTTLTKARTLLRRAAVRLAETPQDFPEYDPDANILNRCTIDGNLVLTRPDSGRPAK